MGRLGLYGFAQDRRTWEVAGPLKAISQHASVWGKDRKAFFCSCDIARAFDHVKLTTLARAMHMLNIPVQLQYAIIEPLTDTTGTLTFEGLSYRLKDGTYVLSDASGSVAAGWLR